MNDEDIKIIKKEFPHALSIKEYPNYGEHYYLITFDKHKIKALVDDGIVIVVPEN